MWHILPPLIFFKATFSLECVFVKEKESLQRLRLVRTMCKHTSSTVSSPDVRTFFFYYLPSCTCLHVPSKNLFENKGHYCQVYKVLVSETSCLLTKDYFTEHLSLDTLGYTSYNFNITSKGNKMCKHVTTSIRNHKGKLWGKL